ncbi:MAG: hypothetical protein ACRD47_05740 [Nitrososphaeraceae archaeon]|jgi:hypothetical protein
MIGALVISITSFSKDRLIDYVKRDIREIHNLYERHQNPETKKYVKIALEAVNRYCKDFDLHEIDQDLKHIKDITNELDSRFRSISSRPEIIANDAFDEKVKKYFVNLVDFEIHKLAGSRLFVIVLDDDVLPTIYNSEGIIRDTLANSHIFVEFTLKSIDSVEKRLRILICPTRIKNDNLLKAMLEDIIDQKTDNILRTKVFNDASVGLTNKKGISIANSPILDTSQQDILTQKEKCMVMVCTASFHSVYLLYDYIVSTPLEKIKRLRDCRAELLVLISTSNALSFIE